MGNAKNPNAIEDLIINNHMQVKMIDPSLSHSTDDNHPPRAKAQQGQENLLSPKKIYNTAHSLVDLF